MKTLKTIDQARNYFSSSACRNPAICTSKSRKKVVDNFCDAVEFFESTKE